MNPLDEKIRNSFPDESVYKIPKRYSVFSGKSLPSFIKDWLIRNLLMKMANWIHTDC